MAGGIFLIGLRTARSAATKGTYREVQGDGWWARIQIDETNQRIKVKKCRFTNPVGFCEHLWKTGRELEMGKIIVEARTSNWQALLDQGFRMESIIDGYFRGEPAYSMSYFLKPERQRMEQFEKKQAILESILAQDTSSEASQSLPPNYELLRANHSMVHEMAAVFDRVFTSYPSPLTNPAYLVELMKTREGIFYVVKDGDHIASVAGAEIDWQEGHAEMTNCATLPDYRGQGLMSIILHRLEREMVSQGIQCLFSLARSLSLGMNLVLHRAGYRFRGRMLNNCHIMGDYECMNLWVKPTLKVS